MARVIGVVSGKGGVGKTTVTVNIGAALAQKFKKTVTIVDCNLTTSHLSLHVGVYYSPITLNKVLRGEAVIDEAVYQHFSGMNVIPASLSVSELDGVDITLIKDSIEPLKAKNDIILLDAAPGLGREAMSAVKASEELLYVTTPYLPDVLDIVRYQEVVKDTGLNQLGIVMNMVGYDRYEIKKAEIEQLTRLPVIASIPFDKNVKKSVSIKMPVVNLNPYAKASKEFFRLAASLIGQTYAEESILTRLLNRFNLRKTPKPSIDKTLLP